MPQQHNAPLGPLLPPSRDRVVGPSNSRTRVQTPDRLRLTLTVYIYIYIFDGRSYAKQTRHHVISTRRSAEPPGTGMQAANARTRLGSRRPSEETLMEASFGRATASGRRVGRTDRKVEREKENDLGRGKRKRGGDERTAKAAGFPRREDWLQWQ